MHTNGSQFFITLNDTKWMNFKFVGIGRVVFGVTVCKTLNDMITAENERPLYDIFINDCGMII